MTKIIAFSGRKQSGKSTGGEYIQSIIAKNNLPVTFKLYSFADPLKQDICMNLLGLTYDQCYGTDEDKNSLTTIKYTDMPDYDISWRFTNEYDSSGYMTARQVMERVGTNIFRKLKNNIWVDATMSKIKRENYDLAIILDNRFPNEVDSVLQNDGIVIRLTRNLFNSNADAEKALDPDNYDWTKFSLVIDNHNMSIEEKNSVLFNFLKQNGVLPL